jgi:hypothetical protein
MFVHMDDLRAPLHGEVIPAREAEGDLGYKGMLAELKAWAPFFSPLGKFFNQPAVH